MDEMQAELIVTTLFHNVPAQISLSQHNPDHHLLHAFTLLAAMEGPPTSTDHFTTYSGIMKLRILYILINLQRAYAARVTAVVLCICLCMCVSCLLPLF